MASPSGLVRTEQHGYDTSTFNAANMLLTRNGQGYTYDANGNTLTGGGRTNSWDSANRLTQIVFNGTTTSHTYGSDGLRRRTVKGADTADYILDGDSVIRTLQNGVLDKTYFHGLRGPEYERTGAENPTWYVYDGLGSVVGLLDINGGLVSTRKYDVYGSVRGGTGISGSKHKFVGSLGHPSEDDSGLISMRARCYDPVVGRFASQDSARHGGNWYGYAESNPVGRADRNGRNSFSVVEMNMSADLGVSLDAVGMDVVMAECQMTGEMVAVTELEGEVIAMGGPKAFFEFFLKNIGQDPSQ